MADTVPLIDIGPDAAVIFKYPAPFADTVPLIDIGPDAAVMFTEPEKLHAVPPAMLNKEEE